jgi:hypothetical protein
MTGSRLVDNYHQTRLAGSIANKEHGAQGWHVLYSVDQKFYGWLNLKYEQHNLNFALSTATDGNTF